MARGHGLPSRAPASTRSLRGPITHAQRPVAGLGAIHAPIVLPPCTVPVTRGRPAAGHAALRDRPAHLRSSRRQPAGSGPSGLQAGAHPRDPCRGPGAGDGEQQTVDRLAGRPAHEPRLRHEARDHLRRSRGPRSDLHLEDRGLPHRGPARGRVAGRPHHQRLWRSQAEPGAVLAAVAGSPATGDPSDPRRSGPGPRLFRRRGPLPGQLRWLAFPALQHHPHGAPAQLQIHPGAGPAQGQGIGAGRDRSEARPDRGAEPADSHPRPVPDAQLQVRGAVPQRCRERPHHGQRCLSAGLREGGIRGLAPEPRPIRLRGVPAAMGRAGRPASRAVFAKVGCHTTPRAWRCPNRPPWSRWSGTSTRTATT